MVNNHPKSEGIYAIELRPNLFNQLTFDEVIQRQGQFVKWIKAMPCPVRDEAGRHDDFNCQVCHGRGDIYDYQREYWINKEMSRHGLKSDVVCSENEVRTWQSPILDVRNVVRFMSAVDGGKTDYFVESFDGDKIIINKYKCDTFPLSHEPLYVDYAVDTWSSFEKKIKGDGKDNFVTLSFSMRQQFALKTNPYNIMPHIVKVEVFDEENNIVPIYSFNNQRIYFHDVVEKDKILTVKGYTQEPIAMFISPVDIKSDTELKFSNFEIGDMEAICSAGWEVGKGDIVVSQSMFNRRDEIVTRGSREFDNLPYYEIKDFSGEKIYDSDGKTYFKNQDFMLYDENKIKWISDNRPKKNATYSISIMESVAYRVMNDKPSINANENKDLPKHIHLKKLERTNVSEIATGLKNEDRKVGDWSQYEA